MKLGWRRHIPKGVNGFPKSTPEINAKSENQEVEYHTNANSELFSINKLDDLN